jgi:hypothetical protein
MDKEVTSFLVFGSSLKENRAPHEDVKMPPAVYLFLVFGSLFIR